MTKRGGFRAGAVVSLAATLGWASSARAEAVPHASETMVPSSNGRGSIAFNASPSSWRLTQFLEHAYLYPSDGQQSRNFLYDSYPGVRIGAAGTAGTWLSAVAPTVVEYVAGTGIVHVGRTLSGVTFDEYDFQPMSLAENASIMVLTATTTTTATIDAYAIFNYLVGTGSPTPGSDSETITYDSAEDAYYETGPSAVAFAYLSIGASSFHGSTPNNPFGLLNAGSNLANDVGSGGPMTGAVAGFQTSWGALAAHTSATAAWATVLAPDANGAAAASRVRTWINGRTGAQLLADEISGWKSWVTPAPSGASTAEAALDAQEQAMLRMGQVTETGASNGQILASVAPGEWNITWVRDMAYAVVALVKSGHLAEAKAALAFQMGATAGTYQSYVGAPYQLSVCRYFGNGTEQSDSNADGPNIEFDGFGLFLWSLDEYVRASNDTASLAQWWPTVKSKVADVLVSLQDATTGAIAADSSIWEVHWSGQQKHFAYTTITAANGLCSASRLASAASDAADVSTYMAAGGRARDAVLRSMRGPDGTIAQSTEALASGTAWLDAAPIEAINFGLFDPARGTARSTLRSIESGLLVTNGRGYMRDQAGGTYDSQEWVFIDLRLQRAMGLHGESANQSSLLAWNVSQAVDNFGEVSELYDAVSADYTGAAPMVGFGAGAYLIALAERGSAVTPTCGAFANEPALPADAGTGEDASSGGGDDGGSGTTGGDGGSVVLEAGVSLGGDAGLGDAPGSSGGGSGGGSSSGGGCSAGGSTGEGERDALAALGVIAACLAVRRRRSS